jgi:three-Cys-motif partner protein
MSDSLPTVWEIEPHTRAKHAILSKYLQAWMPILTSQSHKVGRYTGGRRTILYVDGFAGPGIYKGGEPGSPVIAIDAAVHHRNFPTPVEMLFIEADPDRFKKLEEVIAAKIGQLQSHPNLHVVGLKKGDCDAVLGELLDDYSKQGVQFGPALAFLDQFGYGAVSMELIKKILEVPICEMFT